MADETPQLVSRCLAGDQAAMVALVERYRGQVFGLCYRMLGQRQDAEDVAQETFVRMLRSLARWDSTRDFEPWLLAIAGNRCRTALASRMRRPQPRALVDHLPDDTGDLQEAMNLAEEIQLALAQLRDQYRQAFVLFHEHQLSYAEIGEAMGCPVGTVKTWVHRARRQLIDHLRAREVLQDTTYAL